MNNVNRINKITPTYLLVFFLVVLFAANAGRSFAEGKLVHIIKIDGTINPAAADYIHEGITRAKEQQAECLIVELNTPGGLLQSTRVIVSDFLTSTIPVIVFVSPSGSQCASAGVFIALASHIAAMSPGTNIGAAHPVSSSGEMDSIMSAKVTNDAAAFIRSIAEKRKRNILWGEEAVRKSIAITETEALKQNVIDLIVRSRSELLDSLNGRIIAFDERTVTLDTKNANVQFYEMGWQFKLLNVLSDPNVAYILMMIGFYGLLFELYNPGAIFPGIAGGISIILALYSMHTISINYGGIALIIFAIILFLLEIKIISHGLLAIGGTVSLFLGSIMLFKSDSTLEFQELSLVVIIPVVGITALFFLFAIGAGLRAQRRPKANGAGALLGKTGISVTALAPEGQIKILGEIWNAESAEGDIASGTPVTVLEVRNLILVVKQHIH